MAGREMGGWAIAAPQESFVLNAGRKGKGKGRSTLSNTILQNSVACLSFRDSQN